MTNINQNGSTKEIFYTENGQISQYYEEGELLYEKQYDGGLISQITYGNGDSISYQYNRNKDMIGMEINGEAAYTWQYNDDGMVSRYVDERERVVEERTYDEWCELTGRTQENRLSISYFVNETESSTVYRVGEEIKEVAAMYDDSDSYTIQYPHNVEISVTSQNGESRKAILQSGEEIVSREKSEKQKEKVEIEKKKKKDKGQQTKNNDKRDEIGNLIEQDGAQYDWEGRLLKACEKDGIKAEYTYDSEGNRTKKTVNGVESIYGIEEGNLIYEETEGETVWYYYGADGFPAAFETDGNMYIYEKDDKGNIIALYNTEGEAETEYLYDDAGNLLEITGNQELGEANPFRYQSAYYDEESNLYYSYGRYYDTEEENFLNEDSLYEAEPEKAETYLSASYYGAAVDSSSAVVYAASGYGVKITPERGILSPFGTDKLYSWIKTCVDYNCYAFAINKVDNAYNPGTFSSGDITVSQLTLKAVKNKTLADFTGRGYSAHEVDKNYNKELGERLICLKVREKDDYHFMKYMTTENIWCHKPGRTAILQYYGTNGKGNPSDSIWEGDYFDVNNYVWYKRSVIYNSSTVYIAYKKSIGK